VTKAVSTSPAKPGRASERAENDNNQRFDGAAAKSDWRPEQPCPESETTTIKRLPPIVLRDLVLPEKNRPMLLFTRTVSLPISSPANSAALSLWREMDNFTPLPSYANRRKKVLRNRHKTGSENGMINGRE